MTDTSGVVVIDADGLSTTDNAHRCYVGLEQEPRYAMLQPPHDEPSIPGDSAKSQPTLPKALAVTTPNGFRTGLVLGILVTVAVVLLIVQNGESAQLDWLAFHFRAPLWIMLVLTAAAGAVVWELCKVGWRRGREQRSKQKAASAKPKSSSRT